MFLRDSPTRRKMQVLLLAIMVGFPIALLVLWAIGILPQRLASLKDRIPMELLKANLMLLPLLTALAMLNLKIALEARFLLYCIAAASMIIAVSSFEILRLYTALSFFVLLIEMYWIPRHNKRIRG